MGQHGIMRRSERYISKPKMDIALVLEQLGDAKELVRRDGATGPRDEPAVPMLIRRPHARITRALQDSQQNRRRPMGELYRARDTRVGRTVALRGQPSDRPDPRAAPSRFLRARASAAVAHPNIAAVTGVGVGGTHYLACESSQARS